MIMITKEEFVIMQQLYHIDKNLVDALIDVLPYFEYVVFSHAIREGYDTYVNLPNPDKEMVETTYKIVIEALKGVKS